MKSKSNFFIGIGGVLIILFGVFYYLGKQSKPNKIEVRLKWLHQSQFAGFYYANEAGFYKDQGLDVKLNPGGIDFPAIQMVSSGSEQFGVTGADQILLAREKGIPVVALAVIYRKSPMVFFAKKTSNIIVPKDFINKTVGVKLGGNEELTYRAMMKNADIDMKSIIEFPVKYDMTPFFSDQVQVWPGYVINEVIVAEEHNTPVNIIWPSNYGVNLYADAIFTNEKMIKEHPDLVKKFITATLKGWDLAVNNPDQAVTYTLKYGDNLNKDHEMKMLKASIGLLKPDNNPIGSMDREHWIKMQNLLLQQGFMKMPVDINQVFTTEFLPR